LTFVETHIIDMLNRSHSVAEILKRYSDVDTLSMGMSHDLESAIQNGATFVRVGTGIFGVRN
jgi:uncharacterized pyridoxal phosphate-containing UPF0001 family protein